MDWTLIDDVSGQVVAQQRFTYRLPVTRLTVETGAWPTGLYRGVIQPAGAKVDGSVRRLSQKMVSLIVRPPRPAGRILFVAPTDMWRAYAANGGHAMTSWRESWHYDSVGYSPTVLNTRYRRNNHYYYGLYERYADIQHYQYLKELSRESGRRSTIAHRMTLPAGACALTITVSCWSAVTPSLRPWPPSCTFATTWRAAVL